MRRIEGADVDVDSSGLIDDVHVNEEGKTAAKGTSNCRIARDTREAQPSQ